MDNLLCFDIMEKIGQEVKIVREIEQNKRNYGDVVDDIYYLMNSRLVLGKKLDGTTNWDYSSNRDFSITDLFISVYCLDPEPEPTHPFVPGRMFQLPDDEVPLWCGREYPLD